MVYNNLSDFLLDNRRGMEEELKAVNTVEEAVKIALDTYDWLAKEYIRASDSYKLVTSEWVKKYGEEAKAEIDAKCVKRFKELLTAGAEYEYDVEHERRVGYSAEEETK